MLRRVDHLFLDVRRLFDQTLCGGEDDDASWRAVSELRQMGSRMVFDVSKSWCISSDVRKRARAAAILGQLRRYDRKKKSHESGQVFIEESFNLIAHMIQREQSCDALSSEIYALGHLCFTAAIPIIAPFADHVDPGVRHAVAFSLGSFANDPLSVEALSKLMDDSDRDVRNWAIFSVGVQGESDSECLRLALLAHLDDPFLDARIEAAAALGKRHDPRLAVPLIRMLKRDGALNGLVEAACSLLKLEEDPAGWFAHNYIAEIEKRFGNTD